MNQLTLFELPPVETKYRHLFKLLKHPLWTEHKAKMIALYLKLFVYVTKHGAYIDGFAGPQQPDKHEMWTAKLVLETEPKWFNQFFLCELNKAKWEALEQLAEQHHDNPKKRSVVLKKGDFNKEVTGILDGGLIREKLATFCLLDQHTFECKWKTVQALSRAKKESMKIEQFYFVPTGWLQRSIAALKEPEVVLGEWWGRDDWQKLARMSQQVCANEFCERFRSELGYKFAHAWPIFERRGSERVMYYMVHATDHDEAPNLMGRAYRGATGQVKEEQLLLDLVGR